MNNRTEPSDRTLKDLNAHYQTVGKLNTYLREANENLVMATFDARARKKDAETANTLQQQFLAMLAHELRNPLAPISLASKMLTKLPDQSPELMQIQGIIDRQLATLTRLLDDLLDAARVESGKISFIPVPVRLEDIINSAVELVESRVVDRHQQLNIEILDDNIVINADAIRLAQAFSNLLINSSKFTHNEGVISITARVVGNNVEIKVEDNGAGIEPALIPTIFDLFTQGTISLARQKGGLGIGLHLVHHVVHLHGGKVWAYSDGPGYGSVFTVLLPLSNLPVAIREPSAVSPLVAKGCKILLVEDNRDASELLSMVLRSEGYVVTTAYDGPSGLSKGCAGHFDVLICDIGLPGIDGFELMRRLHSHHESATPTAISISGYGHSEDQERALAAGFARHLVKPVDSAELLTLVRTLPH